MADATLNGDAAAADLLRELQNFAMSLVDDLNRLTEANQKKIGSPNSSLQAKISQMEDEASIEKLKSWIRFNKAESLATGYLT